MVVILQPSFGTRSSPPANKESTLQLCYTEVHHYYHLSKPSSIITQQFKHIVFSLLLFVFASTANSSVSEAPSAEISDTIAQIEVRDIRQSTVKQSMAVASTFVGMQKIDGQLINAAKDFSAIVPNLYMPDYGSRMTSSIYLRGMGARIDNPVMGMYVDGIGLAGKNSYDFDLFDLRRVDVFRGPQGTLFGKNTIGGVMNLMTLSAFEFTGLRASVSYGNRQDAKATVGYYAKPNDKTGISFSCNYHHCDGFFRNAYDGSKADAIDEASTRLKVGWRDSGTGREFNNVISYNFTRQQGFPYHFAGQQVNHNDECSYLRHNLVEGFSLSIPVGQSTLQSTTSYQLLLDRMKMDQDYMPLSYFTLMQQQQEHYLSEELVLRTGTYSTADKRVRWHSVNGLTASYRYNNMTAPVTFMQDGIDSLILKNANNGLRTAGFADNILISLTEQSFVISSDFLTNSVNLAAYHTSYLNFGEHWLLEAGLRLDFEYMKFRYLSKGTLHYNISGTTVNNRPVSSRVEGNDPLSYVELLPRVAISYNRKDLTVYASVAEGYKAGGFNNQLFSDILQNQLMKDMMQDMGVEFSTTQDYKVSEVITYKPERCLNFEVGTRWRHMIGDRHTWQSQIALYELEVFNQQLTTFPQKGTGRMMTNAGHSRSMGAEISAQYNYKGLELAAAYGYTHATFTRYNNGRQDFAGKFVPYAPQHTLHASATYTFSFDHDIVRQLSLNINTNALGPVYWNEENTEKQDFYALFNANISLKMKYLTLQLWGKNLTQTSYNVFRFVSMGNSLMQSGKPLQFGGKLTVDI